MNKEQEDKPNNTKYVLSVKTFTGKVITFNLNSYRIIANTVIEFRDLISKEYMQFPLMSCQVRVKNIGEYNEQYKYIQDKETILFY
jgi:hypothetical protein